MFLDMVNYGHTIISILEKIPFFRRFERKTLIKYLDKATIEYHDKDNLVFLKGRIGIITHGSVRVVSH